MLSLLHVGLIKIRPTWTTLKRSLTTPDFNCHSTNTQPDTHLNAQIFPSPHDKDRDYLMLFTLWSPLKDTDLYQGCPVLFVPPSSPPICHCVMERLLMLLKGQRDEWEKCSVCLTLSRWLQTLPIHHCLPWATSFCCHSNIELQALQAIVTFSKIMLIISLSLRGLLVNIK